MRTQLPFNNVAWAKAYLHTKWHLNPPSRLATIYMGRKSGGCAPFRGELGLHLTRCGLGRGLPAYQVASSSIQPFFHNRHGPKIGRGLCPFWGGRSGSPSDTMWPGPKLTAIPSGTLIHPAVWPQYMSLKVRRCCSFFGGGELGPHLTQCLELRPASIPGGILIHPAVWPQYTNVTDRTDR